jgi:hypothetical protein
MVEWDVLAPMIVTIVLFLTVGGVLILRPIAKRVGDLLEVYAREREGGMEVEMRQMRELLESMNGRLQLMEERQDFTERLLESGKGTADASPSDRQTTPNG